MADILDYHFLSWFQFFVIAGLGILILLIADRFHIFRRMTWSTSISYHMFFCLVLLIVTISFLAVNPLFHLMILLVVFGFVYRNILAYVRAIFTLYFSKVQMNDRIRLGQIEGHLTGINLGGLHISTDAEKIFFPFDHWDTDNLVLLSEAGKVVVSMTGTDDMGRSGSDMKLSLEQKIFEFPYLATDKVDITIDDKAYAAKAYIASSRYKNSLLHNISKAGFNIDNHSKQA